MRQSVLVFWLWLLVVAGCAALFVHSQLKLVPTDIYARTVGFQLIAFSLTWLPWLVAGLALALVLVRWRAPGSTRRT